MRPCSPPRRITAAAAPRPPAPPAVFSCALPAAERSAPPAPQSAARRCGCRRHHACLGAPTRSSPKRRCSREGAAGRGQQAGAARRGQWTCPQRISRTFWRWCWRLAAPPAAHHSCSNGCSRQGGRKEVVVSFLCGASVAAQDMQAAAQAGPCLTRMLKGSSMATPISSMPAKKKRGDGAGARHFLSRVTARPGAEERICQSCCNRGAAPSRRKAMRQQMGTMAQRHESQSEKGSRVSPARVAGDGAGGDTHCRLERAHLQGLKVEKNEVRIIHSQIIMNLLVWRV